jgi:hypothetical protein
MKKLNHTPEITYLAVPYTHADPKIRHRRFERVNKVAAKLMKEGHIIFSPISHSHPIEIEDKTLTGANFWINFDAAFLKCSKKLIVLKLEGWEESVGVAGELKIAKELGIPIEFLSDEEI